MLYYDYIEVNYKFGGIIMLEVSLYYLEKGKNLDRFVCKECNIVNGVLFLRDVTQIKEQQVKRCNISYNMNVVGITMILEVELEG